MFMQNGSARATCTSAPSRSRDETNSSPNGTMTLGMGQVTYTDLRSSNKKHVLTKFAWETT